MDSRKDMPIEPSRFWGTDWDKHPPLTPAMVEAAQTHFGVRLPGTYIALLEVQNGGYTKGFVFPSARPTSWAQTHVPLNELSGIGAAPPRTIDDFHGIHNIYATELHDARMGPAATSGPPGGGWPLVDHAGLPQPPQPRVLWIESDTKDELPLADSFEKFLAGLLPESDLDPETFELPRMG